ncbi:uncharacterized protein LOC142584846 isoform X1 [Dermacentor variabilis]|uniref:uncharacterized protein LOC142584846 isoform X1 n=1 Tax=Dermacentor variabilis TaxID=34621 RepID=UPI003F5C56F4
MMQYLLTIVFLICTLWVVVGVLYFIYGKRGAGKTTPDDESGVAVPSCPGTADGGKPSLLYGKLVICSVRQDSSANLWVRLPEGVCHVFVALGLTQSDGSVQEGLALSVERLRAVDGAQALVSVDYAVLTSNTDGFGRSLNTFMGNVPSRFKRHFNGIEVRGIPVADYTDAGKMTALNTAIGAVKTSVSKVQRVIATVAIPLAWKAPGGTLAKSASLTNVDTTVAQIHYIPGSGSCNALPSNSISRMDEIKSVISSWDRPCISIMLGAILYTGASGKGSSAQSCTLYRYCKAETQKSPSEVIADAKSRGKKKGSDYIIYDTPDQIQEKAGRAKDRGCLYVDHIELDDADCQCQHKEQFPLLSRVRKGLQ